MNPKAKELREKADNAKRMYMAGAMSYEDCVKVCSEYIDFANELAVDIAKRFGMKPKKMSVKAFMR